MWNSKLVVVCMLLSLVAAHGINAAEPPEEIAHWIRDLQQGQPAEIVVAADELGKQGEQAASALPELRRLLGHEHADVRMATARALGHIGVADPSLKPGLLEALGDERFASSGQSVRITAAWAIGQLKLDAIPDLIRLLESAPMPARRAAAVALHAYGEEAKAAVPALVELLREEDAGTRREAMFGLMGIGPAAAAAVPELTKLLSSDNFHTQYWACRALGRIGAPAAKSAVPEMIRLMREGVASVRGNAAAALGAIGPAAGPEIVAPLAAALKDPTHTVRKSAAVSLGLLGHFAQSAAPDLEAALKDKSFASKTDAAVALWRITGQLDQTIDVLIDELQSMDAPWEAAKAFEMLGVSAAGAVPRLRTLLYHKTDETRLYAAASLGAIGAPAQAAIPDLLSLLVDPNEDVRVTAAEAISRVDSAAVESPVPTP
jgi:HEAT repeat protein